MTISIHIEGVDARMVQYELTKLLDGYHPESSGAPSGGLAEAVTGLRAAEPVGTSEPAPVAEEPVKRTRRTKAEIAADAAAAAKPTDPAPPNTAAPVGGEAASSSTAEADEPPAITHEEVRNQIIDLLNDWSEGTNGDEPRHTNIRREILAEMMPRLDAEKISTIPSEKYALVPALVDESRAALAAYKEQRAVEE